MALVLDTGPLYALLDRDDAHHDACRQLVQGSQEQLVIPAPVLPEVDYFIHARLYWEVRLAFLRDIQAGFYQIEDLRPVDYDRILEVCERYADSHVGFVDAAVLAVVERLNEPKLATLDHRHFSILRPRHVASLTLLP